MAQAPALDEVIFKGYDPKLTRRLFTFVLPYRGFLGLSLLLMFISSGAAAVGPYLVKVALDLDCRRVRFQFYVILFCCTFLWLAFSG